MEYINIRKLGNIIQTKKMALTKCYIYICGWREKYNHVSNVLCTNHANHSDNIFIRVVNVLRLRPNEGDTRVVDDEGIIRGRNEDVYSLCVRTSMTCKWIMLCEE